MCKSVVYDYVTAEYICTETGEVFGDRIVDTVPASNVLPVLPTIHDYGIGSTPAPSSGPLYKVLRLLNKYANIVNAPTSARIHASLLARKFVDDSKRRGLKIGRRTGHESGKRHKIIASTCLYIALRTAGVNMDIESFASAIGVNPRLFTNWYTRIALRYGIKVEPVDATSLIASKANNLNIPPHVVSRAIEICKTVKPFISSKPRILATSCVYQACIEHKLPVTGRQVSSAFGTKYDRILMVRKKIEKLLNTLKTR